MPWLIERTDTSSPMYLSLKLGRDIGTPSGAFTASRLDATVFATAEATTRAMQHLGPAAQLCAAREAAAKRLPPELGGFPSGIQADIHNRLKEDA